MLIERQWGPWWLYFAFLPRCWGLALEVHVQSMSNGPFLPDYLWAAFRVRIGPLNAEIALSTLKEEGDNGTEDSRN